MECPKCKSSDVVSCQIAYEQGTSKTAMSGDASSTGSGGNYQEGNYTGTAVTQTGFAKRAAPPASGIVDLLWGLMIFGGITIAAVKFSGIGLILLAGIPTAIVTLLLVRKIVRLPQLSRDRALWEKTWICKRCGDKFLPA